MRIYCAMYRCIGTAMPTNREDKTMNRYEAKQEARRLRLEARADRLRQEGEGRIARARDMASVIPFGQPILIGHHSEGRDRNYRAKIRGNFEKGFEALKEADEAASRAASVGSGGISSDDPDAVAKLTEELQEREARHAAIKARAHESWELSNSSANMRRIKLRIEQLQKAATREHKEITHSSGMRVVQNVEENRIQLFFPGKPDDATRTMLKQRGFRWSPYAGAWQRHLNNAGVYAAQEIMRKLAVA